MTERRCGTCRYIHIMFGYATCPWINADDNHVTPGMKCKIPDSRFKNFKETPEKFEEYNNKYYPLSEMLRDSDACIHGDGSSPRNCKFTGKKCTPRIPDPDKKLASCMFTIKCPKYIGILYKAEKGKFVPVNEEEL